MDAARSRQQEGISSGALKRRGALDQWVQVQGHLQTLGVFEIEAPTLSERLKYRHHHAMLELMAPAGYDNTTNDDAGCDGFRMGDTRCGGGRPFEQLGCGS